MEEFIYMRWDKKFNLNTAERSLQIKSVLRLMATN